MEEQELQGEDGERVGANRDDEVGCERGCGGVNGGGESAWDSVEKEGLRI